MPRKFVRLILVSVIAVSVIAVAAARLVQAQDAKTRYPAMAPLNQYLIADRNAEIALARSAAPSPFPIKRKFRFWESMVMKPQSKVQTASCVWWSGHGRQAPTLRISGIRRCALLSA